MAKTGFPRFFSPDVEARPAEAAKTIRLRALRLAKEAAEAGKAPAEHHTVAALEISTPPRRIRTPQRHDDGRSRTGDGQVVDAQGR